MTLTTAQQRRHAALLRERDDSPEARANADGIEARAELEDAEAGRAAQVAESARMVESYPILGRITREGGKILSIEHPWTQGDVDRVQALGVDMAFEWCHDPMAGLRQGELVRIYIGTRSAGPRAMWHRGDRKWSRLASRGNYGKNWACGGNWSGDRMRYSTLREAAPDLADIIGRE